LLKPHAVPGATSPFKLELPVGSTAMIALIFPGFACGIIQLRGPDIECVMMTAGPILSSKWVTAAAVSDNARFPSGMLATCEEKNWSNAYSPGTPLPGPPGDRKHGPEDRDWGAARGQSGQHARSGPDPEVERRRMRAA